MKFLRILGWAIFLGASWTWCIGMYLPALLVRDYGIWAFVVFAVPNVVGAAAMAWVLPDAEASRRLVQEHKTACRWFSYVTLAFHWFFILAIAEELLYSTARPIVFLFPFVLLACCRGGRLFLAAVTTLYSIFIAAELVRMGAIPTHNIRAIPPSIDLVWLAMVCVFGLSLCPYLDLTFHEARQATSRTEGRIAFVIGFVIVFGAALLFTWEYRGWMIRWSGTLLAFYPLGNYWIAQSMLKLALHGRAVVSRAWELAFTAVAITVGCGIACAISDSFRPSYHGIIAEEVIYRLFMSFYALFFPAYVWICIFGKKNWRVWLVAVLIAAPMYWMGFIERQMIWLLPGVAVPFIAGLLPFSRVSPVPSEPSPS